MQELPIVDTSETVPDGFAMGMKRCHFAEAGHHRRVRVQVEQEFWDILAIAFFEKMSPSAGFFG